MRRLPSGLLMKWGEYEGFVWYVQCGMCGMCCALCAVWYVRCGMVCAVRYLQPAILSKNLEYKVPVVSTNIVIVHVASLEC